MFSCLQILEAFLWFVLITLLNVTLIILTLSVSRLLNLLLRLVAFLLFLNPQCLASISRWITASSSWKRFCLFVCRALSSIMVICMLTAIDRKSGSAGMPRPISYAVFCLKKKKASGVVSPLFFSVAPCVLELDRVRRILTRVIPGHHVVTSFYF